MRLSHGGKSRCSHKIRSIYNRMTLTIPFVMEDSMTRIYSLVPALAVFFGLSLMTANSGWTEEANSSKSKIALPARGLCAHRGAMTSHPENTVPAFQEAIRLGAHMIEFDVQLSKDGKLFILHDSKLDRTTNTEGKASEYTLAELKKLDAGSWKDAKFAGVKIPTLEETLEVMPRNVWLNVHLKGGAELALKTAKVIREVNRQHQAFLACGAEASKAVNAAYPDMLICNMERQGDTMQYAQETAAGGYAFIQISGKNKPVDAPIIALLKENNVKINYFGTDDPVLLRQLLGSGVDFPLVNDLAPMMDVAKEFGIEPLKPVFNMP